MNDTKALLAITALMSAPMVAHAELVEYTYSGFVSGGTDTLGLFTGVPGTDLAGYEFVATFDLDLRDGFREHEKREFIIYGGSGNGYTTPVVNSSITINGRTVAIDGRYSGYDVTQDYIIGAAGGLNTQAVSGFDNQSQLHVTFYSSNLPFSLWTPVPLYTATAPDQVDGFFLLLTGGLEHSRVQAGGALIPTTLTVARVTGFAPLVTPYVIGKPGLNGWYITRARVAWNVSGVPAPTVSGCATASAPNTEGKKYTCSATNDLGSATDSVTMKVDTVKPTVTITSPADGATYTRGSLVAASYVCADEISGVESCSGLVADGTAIKTSKAGTFTFRVNSVSNAGLVTHKAVSYTVN